jgi:hypothetical protein
MRSRLNAKPARAFLTFLLAAATAIFVASAVKADDLATAKQLTYRMNALMSNIPKLSFKGRSGKVYCKWVTEKLSVDQTLLVIVSRNPSFRNSGAGLSHDQTIAVYKKDIAIAKKDVATCRTVGF